MSISTPTVSTPTVSTPTVSTPGAPISEKFGDLSVSDTVFSPNLSTEPQAKPPRRPRVAVVMPALNAGQTLEEIVASIDRKVVDEIILVDDSSTDNTVELARRLNIRVIWHPHNVGYGGNQKTCYLDALQRDPDIVVMLHPDGQYEASLIPDLIRPIVEGQADLVLGSRLAEPGSALAGGMPRSKYLANRALTMLENLALGTDLSEMHTGYRAYSRELLLTVPFLRNSLGFSFDSEMLMQAVHFGFRIAEIPARSRYFDDASSIGFKDATTYGVKSAWMAGRYLLNRWGALPCRKFQP